MEISALDIKNTVVKKLKQAFPECNIYSNRVEQNMKKPCFHLDIVPFDAPRFGKYGYHIHYFVNCTYFSVVEGVLDDNLIAWDKWKKEFLEPFPLATGQFITPQEQKCILMEGLYRFSFNVEETFYIVPTSDVPLIGEVKINTEKEV